MESRAIPRASIVAIPVRIRAFCETDTNFVLNSWLRHNRTAEPYAQMQSDIYYYNHQLLIGSIARNAAIWLACAEDNPDEIWGYICAEPGPEHSLVVHYIYIKQRWRKFGFAKQLLAAAGWRPGMQIWASHWSDKAEQLGRKVQAKHNPYLLYKGL